MFISWAWERNKKKLEMWRGIKSYYVQNSYWKDIKSNFKCYERFKGHDFHFHCARGSKIGLWNLQGNSRHFTLYRDNNAHLLTRKRHSKLNKDETLEALQNNLIKFYSHFSLLKASFTQISIKLTTTANYLLIEV